MCLVQVAGPSSLSPGCEVEITGTGAELSPLPSPDVAIALLAAGVGQPHVPDQGYGVFSGLTKGQRHVNFLFQLQL